MKTALENCQNPSRGQFQMFLSPPVIAIISVQDVVVSSSHRGKQLGKLVVSLASVLAARLGCYKVTHNCGEYKII